MKSKVLIVEDELDIGRLLYMQVENMGYSAEHVSSGEEALALLNRNHYDLMLLDWMLPGLSGIEIAQLVRKMDTMKDLGILMLTAKSDPDNIVEGLEAGADDYISKPFTVDVLKARMASLLRRVKRAGTSAAASSAPLASIEDEIEIGPLRVCLKSYKAYLDGEKMNLTPSEFKLLSTMLENRGRVLTRAKLIEEVQGEGISVIGRTIDTHVFGLRKKMGVHAEMIETVRGIGYRVRDDLFKKTEKISIAAIKWLVGYFVINLLVIGTVFRIYINSYLQGRGPWAVEMLQELDKVLIFSFWGLVLFGFIFSALFVKVFFGPLAILIGKAKLILKGDFSMRKSAVIKESRGEWYQLDLFLNKIWKELKKKKADVAKERGELEAVITAASDAILAIDSDLNIRYYNAPMALLFDQKEEGHLGKTITEVIRNQKITEGFQKAIKDQKSQWVEAQQEMSLDSAVHYFKVSISPFLDEESSKPRGAVAIFHDITDHKKVEKVRMDFVANASHELKTPLTSIQGYLGHIKTQCKDQKNLDDSFEVVENNMERLNSIIQDLLQLSKIESAEVIGFESLSTLEMTEAVIHDLQGRVKDKNQEIHFQYDVKEVIANKEMLEHVMVNLIENAIKYSPQASQIRLRWGVRGDYSFFSVKDNGPGVESYHQGRLFERFYRVRDEMNKNVKGTGLGLSIVRNCMQKMGGTVDVKSAPGLGSEFVCYFPIKK